MKRSVHFTIPGHKPAAPFRPPGCLLLAAFILAGLGSFITVGAAPALDAVQAERLKGALAPLHERFDSNEQMLREPFSSPGYHTTLTGGFVHSTRSSLNYAVALLDTRDEALRARAEAILTRVIALQDQDPASKTYGIWSWFLEEPLDKMSPPDWNWADFCGTALLQVALDHRDRISPEVVARVDAAIQHAARSIRRRNVGPSYTNIAIMGSYVTLMAADLYKDTDLRDYAVARWRRFHQYTIENGGFSEYNSPTYTVVALKELGRIRQHVKAPEITNITEEIYQLAWKDIAQHFHPPTRQWAGPHSRCYRTLLGNEALELIQRGTQGRVSFGLDKPTLDEVRFEAPCPREFETFFTRLDQPREVRQIFVKSTPPVVGTTFLDLAFTLGSVNRGDLWNQRRPLLAYFGTAQKPAYLRLRFLHDDYDFTAAQFFSVQQKSLVLAGVNFATDGGDRHPSLDKIKNGTFKAKDLRLRFEFGGAASQLRLTAPASLADWARVRFHNLDIRLLVPWAAWGNAKGTWQAGKDSETAFLDVVFYSGEPRSFNLSDLDQAALGLVVSIGPAAPAASGRLQEGLLKLKADSLSLELPTRPASAGTLQKSFRGSGMD